MTPTHQHAFLVARAAIERISELCEGPITWEDHGAAAFSIHDLEFHVTASRESEAILLTAFILSLEGVGPERKTEYMETFLGKNLHLKATAGGVFSYDAGQSAVLFELLIPIYHHHEVEEVVEIMARFCEIAERLAKESLQGILGNNSLDVEPIGRPQPNLRA